LVLGRLVHNAEGVAIANNYAYIADWDAGLKIIEF